MLPERFSFILALFNFSITIIKKKKAEQKYKEKIRCLSLLYCSSVKISTCSSILLSIWERMVVVRTSGVGFSGGNFLPDCHTIKRNLHFVVSSSGKDFPELTAKLNIKWKPRNLLKEISCFLQALFFYSWDIFFSSYVYIATTVDVCSYVKYFDFLLKLYVRLTSYTLLRKPEA